MELVKLTTTEIRKMSVADMKEAEEGAREQLAMFRLRAPLNKEGINVSQQRKLRRVLARLLTIRTEQKRQTTTTKQTATQTTTDSEGATE